MTIRPSIQAESATGMQVLSVNVGLPRGVPWHRRTITTGIFKTPVSGRVTLRAHNLDGDRQADLSVHGGVAKAVYCYPAEHYAFWESDLGRDLEPASFGENLTISGLTEDAVHLGDEFTIGSARVVVSQPRLPCYKLGIRLQSDDIVKRFLASGRSGFYVAIVREGDIGAGDVITPVSRDPRRVSISDTLRLHVAGTYGPEEMALARRALEIDALPEGWKETFRERMPG